MPTFNDFERGPVVIDDDEHICPTHTLPANWPR